jgi:1,4-alpha-glucan branching enzyme
MNANGKMEDAATRHAGLEDPVSVYEVHPGSWMRMPEEGCRPLTYDELAPKLANYVRRMNFTHIELLSAPGGHPCSEPPDLGRLVGQLHKQDIKVILDQPPSGYPTAQPHKHVNLEAVPAGGNSVDGLRTGDAFEMANAGSGFKLRWDTSWTRDMLGYLAEDPINRKHRHPQLTVHCTNTLSDHCVLPLSHEVVARGKCSLIARMPGDEWQKFANLRLLYGCMYAQPGKKLLFMGDEFGQWNEWNPDSSLDWHLLENGNCHRGLQNWVADLNHFYGSEHALYQTDASPGGFEWVDSANAELSIVSWLRRSAATGETILAVFNFTPVPRDNHRVGVPAGGFWKETLNSDAKEYGGSGRGNLGGIEASPFGWNFKTHSLSITLPPLGAVFFKQGNGG